jgi:hypothetical protein
MTGNEMITSLGYRLEDTSHVNFASAQKLVALNDAQRQAISMLTNDALVHLQTSRSMGTATADTDLGSLLFFSLPTSSAIITDVTATAADPTVFTKTSHGLIDGDIVKLYDFTQMTEINGMTGIVNQLNSSTFEINGVAADPAETSVGDDLGGTVEKLETSMTRIVSVYDDTNDRFVELTTIAAIGDHTAYNYGTKGALFNNRLYVSSSTATSDCTLVYITSPSNIAATDTEITYLSDSVQQVIVELAESLLWRQDNRQNRASAAANNAAAMIQVINAQGV